MSTLHTKNVPPLERVLRILVAAGAVAAALIFLPHPWAYIAALSAIGFSFTGFFGYCPACAMIGRRI